MFQFLIGRLKTGEGLPGHLPDRQFQFLIGRLKTGHAVLFGDGNNRFQFLIGRLKTHFIELPTAIDIAVSIPYRQAKNFCYCETKNGRNACFNSL